MATNGKQNMTLTPKQYKALRALASGADYRLAATAAGIAERTIHRWRELPAFNDELRRISDSVLNDATTKMKAHMSTAVDVLVSVMQDDEQPAHARVRAAVALLETGLKMIEATEVLERLDALERAIS